MKFYEGKLRTEYRGTLCGGALFIKPQKEVDCELSKLCKTVVPTHQAQPHVNEVFFSETGQTHLLSTPADET